MRPVDTNVIVRYLTGDDPAQADKARAMIGHTPVFVPRTVLLEVEWVLRGGYELSPERIIPAKRFVRSGTRPAGIPVEELVIA